MKKMNCCYIYTPNNNVCNNFFEKMLYKSINTLLMFYHNDIENLYILIDNNIKDNKLTYIKNIVNKINNDSVNIIFKLVDLNITNCLKYPELNLNCDKINRIGLLKFFIPYLVDCDNVLYCDIDILFNENVLDDIYTGYDKNKTLFKIYQRGYNSGLILFNCNEWRKNKTLLQDIIEYYNVNKLKYVDNDTFAWLALWSDKYSHLVVKDDNYKINYQFDKNIMAPYVTKEDYHWSKMNIIHVTGWFDIKKKYFNEIYNWILNKNENN